MSQKVREELLPRLRQRYEGRGKEGKGRLLDEVCEQFGYSRKHAIKLLGAKAGWGGDPLKGKGRPATYGQEVVEVLLGIWKASEQPCGKRLVASRKLWLPHYEKEQGKLCAAVRQKVLSVSAAQVDRLLARHRAANPKRGRCGTKPGSLLKHHIPIRTDNWDITQPGYLEADTVAHCGDSLEGDFIWSVTYTDIFSGWTLNRAVWNKAATGIVEATRQIESELPFALLGFDCDNGSEFLNWHLVTYLSGRKNRVGFTRSRPYHKNDNGHVEQKNWTHVRQLLGYDRLDDPDLLAPINALYPLWQAFHNFFCPSAKLLSKDRHGAKIKRRHDSPMTPCDRLLACPSISHKTKAYLRQTRAALNPFHLQRQLNEALRPILQRAARSTRPAGSLHRPPVPATNLLYNPLTTVS